VNAPPVEASRKPQLCRDSALIAVRHAGPTEIASSALGHQHHAVPSHEDQFTRSARLARNTGVKTVLANGSAPIASRTSCGSPLCPCRVRRLGCHHEADSPVGPITRVLPPAESPPIRRGLRRPRSAPSRRRYRARIAAIDVACCRRVMASMPVPQCRDEARPRHLARLIRWHWKLAPRKRRQMI